MNDSLIVIFGLAGLILFSVIGFLIVRIGEGKRLDRIFQERDAEAKRKGNSICGNSSSLRH